MRCLDYAFLKALPIIHSYISDGYSSSISDLYFMSYRHHRPLIMEVHYIS